MANVQPNPALQQVRNLREIDLNTPAKIRLRTNFLLPEFLEQFCAIWDSVQRKKTGINRKPYS
jgi:hypothetical protein